MNEIDFYSYSLFVQGDRGYHKNWKYVIFKAKYGRWINTKEREGWKCEAGGAGAWLA